MLSRLIDQDQKIGNIGTPLQVNVLFLRFMMGFTPTYYNRLNGMFSFTPTYYNRLNNIYFCIYCHK